MIPLLIIAAIAAGVAVVASQKKSAGAFPPAPPPLPQAAPLPARGRRPAGRPAPPAARAPSGAEQAISLRKQRLAAALQILDSTDPQRAAAVRTALVRRASAARTAPRRAAAAAPVVPDAVMRVLGDRDAREGELESALNLATQGGFTAQARILEARLNNVRRIIGILEQADVQGRSGNLSAARSLLVQGRNLAVADGRSAVIATIDSRIAALAPAAPSPEPRAAIPQAAVPQGPQPQATADPVTQEVVAIRDELARARDAQDLPALTALVPRMQRAVTLLRNQGRTAVADEVQSLVDQLQPILARAAVTAIPPEMAETIEPSASGITELALQVARNIARSARRGYNRALLVQFQTAAGLDPDGKYGPQSRAALLAAGVPAVAIPPTRLYW